MQFILISILAGLIGTTVMTTVLWIIDRTGWANADMVRALGSAITQSYESSLVPGLLLHFGAGIPFAMLYIFALSLTRLTSILSFTLAGGIIGLFHGFAFSFILVILAENHPVEKFQNAGFEVALSHFVAHILFGGIIGFIASVTGYLI